MKKYKIMRFCTKYFIKHYWKFLLIILFEIISATASPMISYNVKKIVDYISFHYSNLSIEGVLPHFFLLVSVILISIFTNRASGFINMFTMPIIRMEIRKDSFAYLQKHSHNFFTSNFSGSLGYRVNELSNQFSTIFSMFLFNFLPVIVSIITTMYLIFFINKKFSVFIIMWMISYLTVSFLLGKGLKIRSKIWASHQSAVSGRIVDAISNIFNIRAFANYDFENKHLDHYLGNELAARRSMFVFLELNRLFQGIANLILLSGSVFLAINMLIAKLITLGDFILIYSLNYTIMNNLEKIGINILDLFESIGNFKDSIESIYSSYEVRSLKSEKNIEITGGAITFSSIYFGYNKSNKIFENLNIKINKKEKIGLVGVSGSGKTTFTNLLLRLYNLDYGKIEIDGQDISKINIDSLHKNISLIPQDPILFNRSILENIRYGNIEATDDEVFYASKKAYAHEFIENLEHGYNSLVGERGVKLSGGQRQRIAIARAFVKNSKIIIMDEATSSLDSITEQAISASFQNLFKDKTVIIIAHRLSTLKLMDRIILFHEGKIIEDGHHQDLIKQNGRYAQMWNIQQYSINSEVIER